MQFQADLLGVPVLRPRLVLETTALRRRLPGRAAWLRAVEAAAPARSLTLWLHSTAASSRADARPQFEPGVMAPTLAGSVLGVLAGVALLQGLSQHWLPMLQGLLGLTILVAAADLLVRPAPQPQLGSRLRFGGFGLLSGLLGGLFSTAGPPLVYHFYRQPLPLQRIRDALVTVFAVNAALRLVLMGGSGQLDRQVLMLSAEALPVVWLITRAMAGRTPPVSNTLLRRLVCGLLSLVALSLMASALRRL
jgi:uncharacterized membrane protein YfcA